MKDADLDELRIAGQRCRHCGCSVLRPCVDPITHGDCYLIDADTCSACQVDAETEDDYDYGPEICKAPGPQLTLFEQELLR